MATAGLWNCHVHLIDPALTDDAPAVLKDMLLRYGFTNVVDTGSDLGATRRLSSEIEAGPMAGPRIVTANGSFDVAPAEVAAFQQAGVGQLREYAAAGGEIAFGTDMSYMRDYDTAEEFEMMRQAGVGFRETPRLAHHGTGPALRRRGGSAGAGRTRRSGAVPRRSGARPVGVRPGRLHHTRGSSGS